ncbi:type II toxin-antitoxin system VapC family toxin [Methylobacterium sp. 77]|uniref:type II toxin-antitoxin system VapC family toxin n=1 Tax=Methylobacterium sp. 77 TaxID=1101192 RepID=UPI00036EA760|nr:type II toxin-antitoxin system VapC family toxin [Methylobacterium sp. 77]
MYVDSSAIVAMMTDEPEGRRLSEHLEAATHRITSALAIYEAALAIRRKRLRPMVTIQADIAMFLDATDTRVVSVPGSAADRALSAFEQFGKGTGHPAQLNMGDCFSYAMADLHGVPLLFNGRDFVHTDIAQALA